MYHSSGKTELEVVGGSLDLSVCQRVDKSGLSTVRYFTEAGMATYKIICVILFIMPMRLSIRLCSRGCQFMVFSISVTLEVLR